MRSLWAWTFNESNTSLKYKWKWSARQIRSLFRSSELRIISLATISERMVDGKYVISLSILEESQSKSDVFIKELI